MSELLNQLATIIQDIIRSIGYPGISLIIFTENIFPPIPSELVLPFAGFLVGRGEFSFLGVWIAATIGSVVGALVLYYIGMWAGDVVIRNFLRRWGKWLTISEADYERSLKFFDRYGDIMIFVGRLIPIIRSIISLPAGANHSSLPRFILFTTIGSAIWNGVLAYAGMVLGENWERVIDFVGEYQDITVIVLVIVAVIVLIWFINRWLKARRVDEAIPEA